MKRKSLMLVPVLLLFFALGFQSCDKEEEEPKELIADNSTFAGFENWSLDVTKYGIDPSLGTAHGGNDANTVRKIYFKDGVKVEGDEYPVGALIAKRSTNDSTSLDMITGMVKRGNDFDTEHNNWEYFVIMPDGKIATDEQGNAMRGTGLMDGMCLGCHSNAAAKDYIFSK